MRTNKNIHVKISRKYLSLNLPRILKDIWKWDKDDYKSNNLCSWITIVDCTTQSGCFGKIEYIFDADFDSNSPISWVINKLPIELKFAHVALDDYEEKDVTQLTERLVITKAITFAVGPPTKFLVKFEHTG